MREHEPIPLDRRAKTLAETVMAERKVKSDQAIRFEPEQTREELIAGAYLRLLRAVNP